LKYYEDAAGGRINFGFFWPIRSDGTDSTEVFKVSLISKWVFMFACGYWRATFSSSLEQLAIQFADIKRFILHLVYSWFIES